LNLEKIELTDLKLIREEQFDPKNKYISMRRPKKMVFLRIDFFQSLLEI